MNKKYVILLMAFLIFGPFLAYAWTPAPPNPPTENVATPIDQGATAQSKVGGLLLNTGGATDGLIVQFGKVGIGTTTPGQKLDVAGSINIAADSAYMYNGANVIIAQPARDNYFLGNAGNLTTTGLRNTASGYQALYSITEGYNNVANGMEALKYNTTGHSNTAYGVYSLKYNTTGHSNTAYGGGTLFSNTTGIDNIAVGLFALQYNTIGSFNTVVGRTALTSNISGNYNTAIGYEANVASDALTNATAIGNGAIVNASNKVMIGNTSVTSIGGQVGWSVFSDERLKKNIKESPLGLDFILKLKPVTFNYKATGQSDIIYKNRSTN